MSDFWIYIITFAVIIGGIILIFWNGYNLREEFNVQYLHTYDPIRWIRINIGFGMILGALFTIGEINSVIHNYISVIGKYGISFYIGIFICAIGFGIGLREDFPHWLGWSVCIIAFLLMSCAMIASVY